MKRSGWWVALVGLCVAAAVPGRAQEPASLPDTPLGKTTGALLKALSSSEETEVRQWSGASLATELFHDWTPERYQRMLAKLRQQSGGLELVRVLGSPEPHTLTVLVRARNGGQQLGLELIEHAQQKGKLHLLDLHPFFPPAPSSAPLPEQKLSEPELTAAVERRLEEVARAGRFSGVVLVARGDRILHHRAYGEANREKHLANTLETRFHTGSVGKMFTAVAIAQLVEAGKLRYEDTLATALPGFLPDETARKVKIEQILTHTAGLPDVFSSPRRKKGASYDTLAANLELIRGLPLDFEPGARHQYSNGGFAVLAAVVERVSGMPFAEYLRERIYRPAEMVAADPKRSGALPWAIGYSHRTESDPLGIEPRQANGDGTGEAPVETPGFTAGYLTAQDLHRFFRALRSGKLVKPETVEKLSAPAVEIGGPLKMGLGFYHIAMSSGTTLRGHSGGGGASGIGAHAEMLWENDLTLIVLGNYDLEQDVRPLTLELARFLSRQ